MSEIEEVHRALLLLLGGEQVHSDIKRAEAYLKEYIHKPFSVPVLFQLLASAQSEGVRQLSAVLLRRTLTGHWIHQTQEFKAHVKQNLFQLLTKDPNRLVRLSISQLISKVGRICLSSPDGWADFLPTLLQVLSSPNFDHQECCLSILTTLFENSAVVDEFKPVFGNLHTVLLSTLQATYPSIKVKLASIKMLGAMLGKLHGEGEMEIFQPLFPAVMHLVKQFIDTDADDEACEALSVFDDIIESEVAFDFIKPSVPAFVHFILEVGADSKYDTQIRQTALTTITWLCQFKPKQILKHKLLHPVLQVALKMSCEPEDEEDEEDDFGENDNTSFKFGAHLIDRLALHVSPKQTFNECRPFIQSCALSANPYERKAALSVLTILCRGATDFMLEELESLMPVLYSGLEDGSQIVRRLACVTLGQWAEHLQPDILEYHEQLLPRIIKALHDTDKVIQERTCYSLVAFLENLDDEPMMPYVEPIMSRLVELLRSSQDKNVQDVTISGISAVATIAGELFLPFYPAVLDMMKQLALITDVSTIELRGRAIECAGLVAVAIGKELFSPHLEFFVQQAKGSLKMGEEITNELREYVYSFFSNLAELAGEDFAVFLPEILPMVLAGLSQTGATKEEIPALAGVLEPSQEGYQIDNAFLDVKIQALSTLSIFAYKCKSGFLPCIEICTKAVLLFLKYIHPALRKAAVTPAEAFITTVGKAFPSPAGKKWVPGVPVRNQPPSEQLQQIMEAILPVYFEAIEKDPIIEVVIPTLDSLVQIAKQFGPCVLEVYHAQITQLLESMLRGGLVCQIPEDEDEENYYDDEGEKEEQLLSIIAHGLELFNVFVHVFQNRFELYLPLVNSVVTLLGSDADKVRREAMAALAEAVDKLGENVGPQFEPFMDLAVRMMGDTYFHSASNAAFMAGTLCVLGGAKAIPYFQAILDKVPPLLTQDKNKACRDNACGLLGRMLTVGPESLPLEQVLQALISHLPLRKDFNENDASYEPLVKLILLQHPAIASHIPQLVVLFCTELGTPEEQVSLDLKAQLSEALQFLTQKFPAQMQQIAVSLPKELQQNFEAALRGDFRQ